MKSASSPSNANNSKHYKAEDKVDNKRHNFEGILMCLHTLNRKMLARGNGPSIVLFTALTHAMSSRNTDNESGIYGCNKLRCYSMLQYT